ncbi:MAG: hypothetical protein ACI814_004813, partial [Mariniblastus sp.]
MKELKRMPIEAANPPSWKMQTMVIALTHPIEKTNIAA